MKKTRGKVRALLAGLLALAAVAASAQQAPLADEDIRAFLDSYRVVDAMNMMLDEATSHQVETGRLAPEMAACIKERFPNEEVYPFVAPAVRQAYTEPQQLKDVTAFFGSSTGRRMMDGVLVLMREMNWRSLRGMPEIPFGLPASFQAEDVRRMETFFASPAGQTFNRFVGQWLPQLQRQNLWRKTQDVCAQAGISSLPAGLPQYQPVEQRLQGTWRHALQWRVQDGRQIPPQVSDGRVTLTFEPDGSWHSQAPNNPQKGSYRWLDSARIEQVTRESSVRMLVGAVGVRQIRVDDHRLELTTIQTRADLDKVMPPLKPGEVRPREVVIVNVFRRVPAN